MDFPTIYSRQYTITQIYGINYKVPVGYEAVDFRPPITGEFFLNSISRYRATEAVENLSEPRLILRQTKRKVITFIETGETRSPKKGEYYIYPNGVRLAEYDYTCPHHIVIRTESEL